MLSSEDLLEYIRKAKNGDKYAKEIIFTNNTPLIKSIIKRFMDKGVEYEDLFQIASMGLIKAINNFDENFEVKFSTYCVPMVIGEIKRYIRDNGSIKVSRAIKILANKINRFVDEYLSCYSNPPTIETIAKKFSVEQDEVVIALDSVKMPLSIHEKFEDNDEGQELIEKIPSKNNEEEVVDRIHLSNILNGLNDREQKIVVMRFFRDKTQSEIAECLGVSQVQVSRLENKIIEKIRLKY